MTKPFFIFRIAFYWELLCKLSLTENIKAIDVRSAIYEFSRISWSYLKKWSFFFYIKIMRESIFWFATIMIFCRLWWDFPGGSVVKNILASAGNAGDMGLIPGSERSPGGGNGNPFQYSCQDNPMERGTWWLLSTWHCKESDTTEQPSMHAQFGCLGRFMCFQENCLCVFTAHQSIICSFFPHSVPRLALLLRIHFSASS